MADLTYENFKTMVNMYTIPAAVLQVHKNPDGTCGDVIMYAINRLIEASYKALFSGGEERSVEGQPYYTNMPREPKFEAVCYDAAFRNRRSHNYVDTTMMYGYWTENYLLPIGLAEDREDKNIGYCLFLYTLNKEMDSGKYATVSPDVASFVIKTCMNLRNEEDFAASLNTVTKDIREFTNSFATCIMTVTPDLYKFDILSECVRNNELSIKEIFSQVPYEVVETWEWLVCETNDIIIQNEDDMKFYEAKAPEWVATLRQNKVRSLILVPFLHQNAVIGYLYITNFNTDNLPRLKETIEIVAFFLSSEVANHMIMERLEYLSNIDMLTGVYNRNSMNVNVDELSTKLKLNPKPFGVAFCDLNGLKSINDNDGHHNGDQLLKDAAKVLKDIFEDDKIYRAGGDEFVVVSFCSYLDFQEKIRILREEASDPDWLCFAIGSYYDKTDGNLRLAMRYADEEMYKDKDAYYEKYPDKRR